MANNKNSKVIVYTIKVDDSDIKKLKKDLAKLDTNSKQTVNVKFNVDDSEVKRVDQQLQDSDMNVKVKVDDEDVNKIKSKLKSISDVKVDSSTGLGAELTTAAAASAEMETSLGGAMNTLGVMAQLKESSSQSDLASALSAEGRTNALKQVITSTEKIASLEREIEESMSSHFHTADGLAQGNEELTEELRKQLAIEKDLLNSAASTADEMNKTAKDASKLEQHTEGAAKSTDKLGDS